MCMRYINCTSEETTLQLMNNEYTTFCAQHTALFSQTRRGALSVEEKLFPGALNRNFIYDTFEIYLCTESIA